MEHPQAEAAAAWWADQLSTAPRQEMGDTTINIMLSVLSDSGSTPSDTERSIFRSVLADKVRAEITYRRTLGRRTVLTLYADYGPKGVLAEAARETGIPFRRFPVKTAMRVDPDSVTVSLGYAGKTQEIWRSSCD